MSNWLNVDWLPIGWFSELIIPFTLTSLFLLTFRRYFLNEYGPQVSYISWLLLPMSLFVPFIELPNWFAVVNQGQTIQRYLAINSENAQVIALESLLVYGWAVGFVVLISYWIIRHTALIRSQRTWQAISINTLAQSKLRVYKSADVYSPMLVGLINPKLVIPEDFDSIFSKEQQALILEHELCHFKRNDMVWNTFALLILAAMWFHPLAWLAFSRFRRDQELSCDQTVLARKHTTCRINYSKALLVAAQTTPPLGFAQLSFKEYGDKNVMFERINLIRNGHKGSKLLGSLMLASAVTLLSAMSYAGDSGEHGMKKSSDQITPTVRIEPVYPKNAADKGLEGSVVLKFDIAPSGDVENVSVVSATPKKVFDKAAKIALRQWKYQQSSAGLKNSLVQLDFLLGPESKGKFQQVEQISVVNH